ncbi:hypothetical protein GOV12_02050 [Candidatus Pacearchaeota archaeon]|nr:hypothetical protein [Candidatus Pacearchaeota archaeon]
MYKRGKIQGIVALLVLTLVVSMVSAGELKVTMEHPFLIDGSWVNASDLVVGDEISTIDGRLARITRIKDVVSDEAFKVYNLEASVFHDFVVGEDKLIVHNSNRPTFEELLQQHLEMAQRDLLRPLTKGEKDAIRNLEINFPGTGKRYLKEKIGILKDAGLNKAERRLLIESGACGIDPTIESVMASRAAIEEPIVRGLLFEYKSSTGRVIKAKDVYGIKACTNKHGPKKDIFPEVEVFDDAGNKDRFKYPLLLMQKWLMRVAHSEKPLVPPPMKVVNLKGETKFIAWDVIKVDKCKKTYEIDFTHVRFVDKKY